MSFSDKKSRRNRRLHRVRTKLKISNDKLRLTVIRSNIHICAQLINIEWKTIVSFSDISLLSESDRKDKKIRTRISMKKIWNKKERAYKVWKMIAKKAKDLWYTSCVFDRSWFSYEWRVENLAKWARDEGLIF